MKHTSSTERRIFLSHLMGSFYNIFWRNSRIHKAFQTWSEMNSKYIQLFMKMIPWYSEMLFILGKAIPNTDNLTMESIYHYHYFQVWQVHWFDDVCGYVCMFVCIRCEHYSCAVHYNDVIMSAMASQITSHTIVYPIVYSGADQRKHESSASLAFVRGIPQWPVNAPHKGPVPQFFSIWWRHHVFFLRRTTRSWLSSYF